MNDEDRQRLQVLCAGILGLILFLGVARFAYTPLLPLMREQAGLGAAAGGWLAAANYAGYLSGALLASKISDLKLKDRLYRASMVVAVAATALMGLASGEAAWALLRFVAGLSTAGGMLLWRVQWYLFGVLGALLAIPAWRWLPRPDTTPLAGSGAHMEDRPPGRLFLALMMGAYFCAGAGFVVSATFIVAIVNGMPQLGGKGAWVFLAVGLAATPACSPASSPACGSWAATNTTCTARSSSTTEAQSM